MNTDSRLMILRILFPAGQFLVGAEGEAKVFVGSRRGAQWNGIVGACRRDGGIASAGLGSVGRAGFTFAYAPIRNDGAVTQGCGMERLAEVLQRECIGVIADALVPIDERRFRGAATREKNHQHPGEAGGKCAILPTPALHGVSTFTDSQTARTS